MSETNHTRKRHRIIAIGRSAHGQPFQMTAAIAPPDDFYKAVAEVDSRSIAQWTTAQHDEVDGEMIGEEFSRIPFLY